MKTIECFDDFVDDLLEAGVSVGCGSDEGVFALSRLYGGSIRWHTGEPDTDPWEWRMRVLEERSDIAYAKLFFGKSGFITKELYPYFLAARRGRETAEEQYERGALPRMAKRVYDLFDTRDALATHEIKPLLSISRDEKGAFERAMTQLQADMLLTMCGRRRKRALTGMEYGWNSTVFCRADAFFDGDVMQKAAAISRDEAEETLRARILSLRPGADEKKIRKMIFG